MIFSDLMGQVYRRNAQQSDPEEQLPETALGFWKDADGSPSSSLDQTADILGAAETPELTVERRSAKLITKGDNTDEVLNGTADDDKLSGEGGNDKVKGKAGNDILSGGDGDDKVIGGGGDDNLKGGGGNDTLSGGGGNDTLKGQGGDDKMKGGGGDDIIKGQGGADNIKGNSGDDVIVGGGGDDTIIAGTGNDSLKGGGGADIFQFGKADFKKVETNEIKKFQIGLDKIDLVALNIGSFDDLNLTQDGNNAVIAINKGEIILVGRKANALSADDFLLTQADRDALLPDEPTTPIAVTPTTTDPTSPTDPTTPTDPTAPTDPTTPNDPNITGDANDNTLDGDSQNNLIRGLGGDDTLGAGEGSDTLEGGTGKDLFAIQLVNGAIDPTLDVVSDFNYAIDGDEIGLLEVLNGISFADLRDVVDARIDGSNTIISVRQSTSDPFVDVLRLDGVQFDIDSLENNALVAPAANSTAFVDNPFGFTNGSRTTADPDATSDGRFVVWVDQQNLDNDPNDFDPNGTTNNAQDVASRDVFILNTSTLDIRRVSLKDDALANDQSAAVSPVVSEDGRFVAYVQGPRNSDGNVFVRDLNNPDAAPIRVDIHQDGSSPTGRGTEILNNQSGNLSSSLANDSRSTIDMSADGSRIVFSSTLSLSNGDSGGTDVYVRDLNAGTTTLISDFDSAGVSSGDLVKISDDGRYVLLTSKLEGASGDLDLYLVDTQTGDKLLISSPTPGVIGGFDMSADGSRIVFATGEAISLADTNETNDIYVADVDLNTLTLTDTQRVSLSEGKFQTLDGFGPSFDNADTFYAPTISPDGTKVIFLSGSLDLVSFGDQHELKSGNIYEKMYLLDLTTGEITVPDTPYAQADDRSLDTNAVLTNGGFFYPTDFTASDGSGSVGNADSIIFGTAVSPDVEEVTGARIQSAVVENETSFRSQIDSASDLDVFFLPDQGDTRNILIYVAGVDSGGGTLADPELKLFRSNGSEIFFGSNSGNGRDEFFEFDGGEDVFIQVSSQDGGTGSYRVTLLDQDFALDDIPIQPADPFMF